MIVWILIAAAPFPLPDALAGAARKNAVQLTPGGFLAQQRKDPDRARVYVDCGLEAVSEADFGQEHVSVFTLRNPLAALCAYGADKTLDGAPVPGFEAAQSEAHKQPGSLHLWRGNLYVKIRGKGGDKQLSLLRAMAGLIPIAREPDPEIEAVRQLPLSDRIPGSERYVARNVYGWTSFQRGYSADYGCGNDSLSIANIDATANPDRVVNTVLAEAKARGYTVMEWPAPANVKGAWPKPVMLAAAPPSLKGPTLYLFRLAHKLIAVDADVAPSACPILLEELLRLLQR